MSASWQDRVRGEIRFTSPSGVEFVAGWVGGERSFEKYVGQHKFAGVDGTLTQDMGSGGDIYPLSVMFEGGDHDKTAEKYMQALKNERGPWTVLHPTKGVLNLQPVESPKEDIQPVERANITVISCTWIVPLSKEATKSRVDPASEAAADREALDQAATAASVAQTVQDNASKVAAVVSSARRNLASLKRKIVAASARVNAIQATINDLLTETIVDMQQVSGAVTELLQAPELFRGSLRDKVSRFRSVLDDFLSNLPDAIALTANDVNAAAIGELFLASTISAAANTVLFQLPETRGEAVSVLYLFRDMIDDTQEALDDLAERTETADLEHQYFGGDRIAESLANLRASMARYLLSIIGDLKTERRFILQRETATLRAVIENYPCTADNADEFYAEFCRINRLKGRQVMLLPALFEAVVYE